MIINPEVPFAGRVSPERIQRFDVFVALVVEDDVARELLQELDFNPDAYDARDFRVADEPLIKIPDSVTPEEFETKVYGISMALWGESAVIGGFSDLAEYLYELNEELAALERKERRRQEAELRALHKISPNPGK